jgi:phosphoserine phosphatase
MNLLCVNCRGCGQAAAVQELQEVVEQYRPGVVFLSETRLDRDRALALVSGSVLLMAKQLARWGKVVDSHCSGGVIS